MATAMKPAIAERLQQLPTDSSWWGDDLPEAIQADAGKLAKRGRELDEQRAELLDALGAVEHVDPMTVSGELIDAAISARKRLVSIVQDEVKFRQEIVEFIERLQSFNLEEQNASDAQLQIARQAAADALREAGFSAAVDSQDGETGLTVARMVAHHRDMIAASERKAKASNSGVSDMLAQERAALNQTSDILKAAIGQLTAL